MENESTEETVDLFRALGDITRVRMMRALSSGKPERIGVTELASMMGITQPAASQHLKILKNVKLVRANKEGNHIYYTFNRDAILRHKGRVDDLFGRVLEKCDRLDRKRKA